MTYCLGIKVREGLIAIADTRITAGTEVYTNKKISIHQIDKHSLFIMTSGLRSVRDKAIIYFNRLIDNEGVTFNYMDEAAMAFGNMIRKVAAEDKEVLTNEGYSFNLHSLVGGQMPHDKEHKLFLVFPEGNYIEINEGLLFQIIGNSNYGKPLLYRKLTYETSLKDALKMGFLSFDATQISASDVGYPIDVLVYKNNTFAINQIRLEEKDMHAISAEWTQKIEAAIRELPDGWTKDLLQEN